MDKIKLKDYRCFHDEQIARLAPLTLLVGENSTGKTSFMAMIRALWDIAYRFRIPDFKEAPYDLGSFDEIAHHRGARSARADTFEAGFHANSRGESNVDGDFEVTFGKAGTTPVPVRRRMVRGETWIDEMFSPSNPYRLQVGTSSGTWEVEVPDQDSIPSFTQEELVFPPYYFLLSHGPSDDHVETTNFKPLSGSPAFTSDDRKLAYNLAHSSLQLFGERPFASAPVRSKPHRTYDPSRPTPDPEGDYVPMYLASVFFQDRARWANLKSLLEGFGKKSGLFDEIFIRALGKTGSEPFQLQVRKFGGELKGPRRNLIDVGYGVSQVLPVITELLRTDAPPMFLLQQPEVHLHPSAQAALGSLFCQVANPNRQLVIETHSDHLLDRVRMEVLDENTPLKPADVSILFFERTGLDVRIHSLRIDAEGNILDAPDSYRRFFLEETQRSLGL